MKYKSLKKKLLAEAIILCTCINGCGTEEFASLNDANRLNEPPVSVETTQDSVITEEEEMSAKQKSELLTDKVLECIMNKDVEALTLLLSDGIKDRCDVAAQISDFFAAIDGNVVSYGKPVISMGPKYKVEGEIVHDEFLSFIDQADTDTGASYSFHIIGILLDTEKKEDEGISSVTVSVKGKRKETAVTIGIIDR